MNQLKLSHASLVALNKQIVELVKLFDTCKDPLEFVDAADDAINENPALKPVLQSMLDECWIEIEEREAYDIIASVLYED